MRYTRIKPLMAFSIFSMFLLLTTFFLSCATAAELAPKITFLAPPGNVYSIGDLTVSVIVTNFNVVDKQGQPAVEGEGHLHYYLDVDVPTTQGEPAVAEPGTWTTTASKTYTFHNVGSGTHTVSVQLVNNDHTPLNPPVVVSKTVVVVPEPGLPHAVILLPRDGAQPGAGDVTVSVETNNFSLVVPTGQTPAAGEGHIIYFMDEDAPTNPGDPATTDTSFSTADTSYTWNGVTAGVHTFSIELVNDDDTPLTPAVVSTITITAK
jgi:hypothetical protein